MNVWYPANILVVWMSASGRVLPVRGRRPPNPGLWLLLNPNPPVSNGSFAPARVLAARMH